MDHAFNFSDARQEWRKRYAAAQREVLDQLELATKAETAYREREDKLRIQAPGLKRGEVTAEDRKIWIEAQSCEVREVRDIAAGMLRVRFKFLDFLLADISAAQTEAGAFKAEAKAAGWDMEP